MKNDQIITERKRKANKPSIKETAFSPKDLIREIFPLIEDYFIGEFSVRSYYITMKFFNGQKFKLILMSKRSKIKKRIKTPVEISDIRQKK